MLLTTSVLACNQPSAASVTPTAQPAIPSEESLPSTGERTYHIVPQQSTASYQAQEKWLRWPLPTKAVAKTGDVEGNLTLIMGAQPKLGANRVRVDLRTLVSEVAETPLLSGPAGVFLAQRDEQVRNLLQTETHPFAEFTAGGLEGLPTRYTEGQPIKVRVPGDLTVRGVTRAAVLETEATLQGETLSGTAVAQILMMDYGVEPPANNGSMDVEDHLTITIKFLANATPIASAQVSLENRHPKLDTPLATLAQGFRDRAASDAPRAASEMGLELVDERIRVVVARGPAQMSVVRTIIEAAGGEVVAEATSATGALIPISAIAETADHPAVRAIRIPLREE